MRRSWFKRHKKLLESKRANVENELDIVNFIRNQRITKVFWATLLTEDQRKFTNRLVDSVLSEGSDSPYSSDSKKGE